MDQNFITKLKDIILKAGEMALDMRNLGLVIEKKSDNSPVTNADVAISNFIYAQLTKLNKDIPIICEEQPLRSLANPREPGHPELQEPLDKGLDSRLRGNDKRELRDDKKKPQNDITNSMFWLIDPIDGTRSYIKNMDSFTVNIALIINKIPVIGLIYLPISKKLYFTDHQGKFCIEQDSIKIEAIPRKSGDLIAVVSSRNFNTQTESFILNNKFSEVISIPSSIKLCMVAEGSCDVYPKFGQTMEWDIAAGHALINAAGGLIMESSTNQVLSYNKTNFENPSFLAMSKRYLGVIAKPQK